MPAAPAKTAAEQRAERARLIISGIRRLSTRVATDSHRIGQQLAKLHAAPRLYQALGYRSFTAMLEGEELGSPNRARRLMAVAKHFTRAQVGALGVSKAFALVSYVETTPEDDVAALLFEADAPIAGAPISKTSARKIERHVAQLRAAKSQPEITGAIADRVARALDVSLALRGAKSRRVRARVASGRWVVDVRLSLDDAMLLAKT